MSGTVVLIVSLLLMFPPTHLRLAEVQCGGQLDAFGRGQVALGLEPALQALQLRVREHGPGLAAPVRLALLHEAAGVQAEGVRVQDVPRHHCNGRAVFVTWSRIFFKNDCNAIY